MVSSQKTLVLAGVMALGIGGPAVAQQPFYQGKTIELVVGSPPGGGFDTYARVLSKHMPKHIPGTPAIVVQNMPGAGSLKAAQYMENIARKDGTVMAAVFPGAIMAPLLDPKFSARYDPKNFVYVGTANVSTRVCATYSGSQTTDFDGALKRQTLMGSDAPGGSAYDYTRLTSNLAGADFKIVPGYPGTGDIQLAMERGEVEGLCGIDWSSLKAQRGHWIRDNKINVLVQIGLKPNPELAAKNVPEIWKYVKDGDRDAMKLVVSQQVFGRPYILPPGTPKEQVDILRKAFDATMVDPDFIKDATTASLEVAPASGTEVQALVEELYAAPADVVKRARAAIAPPE